jgi:hypothetical protein
MIRGLIIDDDANSPKQGLNPTARFVKETESDLRILASAAIAPTDEAIRSVQAVRSALRIIRFIVRYSSSVVESENFTPLQAPVGESP